MTANAVTVTNPISTVPPTGVKLFTADQWAQRFIRLFPKPWAGDDAKKCGGILYSLFNAIGSQANAIQLQFQFCLNAERIATATDVALDAYANDLFLNVTRLTGEPDASFRARIYANLFPKRGTRIAISNMFYQLTGSMPRLIEPWNINDCAVLDRCFIDIDTPQFSSRTSDSSMRKTIMVESILPSFGNQGLNPVYGLDAGLVVDYGWIVDSSPTWFLGTQLLDQALTQTKLGGTTAYRRYSSQALVDFAKSGTQAVSPGQTNINISLAPAISGSYIVIAQPSWNTIVSCTPISPSQFSLFFSAAPPALATVDWMIVPLTVVGSVNEIVTPGITSSSISLASFSGMIPFACCGWNGLAWVSSVSSGSLTFEFDTPPIQTSQVGCLFLPASSGGFVTVPAGQTNVTINLPANVAQPFQAFVTPSWNAACAVTKNGITSLTVEFDEPPVTDLSLYWAIQQVTAGGVV
jgi:hypothetical protein